MGIHIIGDGLERLQCLLGLVNDGLVLQDRTVVVEVDGGGLGGMGMSQSLGLAVAFAESLESGDGLYNSVK